jgi:hypothetical protein
LKRLALAALVAASACSKCGETKGTAPSAGVERVLPAGANAVVIIPKVAGLGDKLKLLEGLKVANFAAQAQNFESAHALLDALLSDFGIDPRSREQLKKIGVAADGSAGVAMMDDGDLAVVAIPIEDEGRVAAFLRTFAANRLGATALEQRVEGGVTVHRVVAPSGVARLAWTVRQGYALVTSEKGVPVLAGWVSRGENETLAKDTALPASLARLPAERDLIVYVPPGSKAIFGGPVSHVAMTLALSERAFTLNADAPWGDATGLKPFEVQAAGAKLLPFLPGDAFLVARYAGEATAAAPLLELVLGPHLKRAFAEGGFDLKQQVLERLAPGTVVGLSLAPTAQMQGMPELDVRRTNPFRWVHLSGVAPAKTAEGISSTLDKLAEVAPKFGARIEKKDDVYLTTWSQGEGVHFAAKGDKVFFGSPLPRVNALLEADGKAAGPIAEGGLQKVLDSSALAMVVDLRKLSDAVRELPSSAWGIGGFAIKATTVRWLDNTDDLKAVTVTAGVKQGALQAKVELMLGAPQK